ncbi:alpha/beta hydrolase [Ruania zhangjianzhongii]|uniref:alpha/beta hydrolase n=1 Tax=Ruania zhangjianzhongii TaxID=2603206 RepID=UPI0011C87281|nr:dienelactone hydrolase family protein [Ruania zhangjianzhongii]
MTSIRPLELPVDPAATVWSVPESELPGALESRPLLVLMHGYGSHEHDLAALAAHLDPGHPGTGPVVASLRAPLPAGPGYAWFPITDPTRAGNPDIDLANAATVGVMRWLEEVQALARTPGPVALLGFSQGGAMVTHLLRHHPEQFSCGVVLSGFTVPGLVGGDQALAEISPPVYWGRGLADPLIGADAVARTERFLTAHTDLTASTFAGLGHGVAGEEIEEVAAFLATHLTAPSR